MGRNPINPDRPVINDRKVLFSLQRDLCRLLVEESGDGLAVLNENSFEYCNSAFINFLGLTDEEIYPGNLEILWQKLQPEDREKGKEWFSRRKELSGLPSLGPLRLLSVTGRSVFLKLSLARGKKDRVIILARDMTELSECRLNLHEKESLLASLINEASTPIFIVQNGKIRFANRAIHEFFGYRPEEVVGTSIEIYLPDAKKDEVLRLYGERLSARPIKKKMELGIKHRNGHLVDVEIELNLVSYEGVPYEIVIMHDISERKRMEFFQINALEKIRTAYGATIKVLNSLVEAKDPYTGSHQKRVAELARTIATEIGLSPEQIDGLRLAAQIHDIGKIIVPSEILSKPGPLSETEWGLVRNHVPVAYELLKDIEFPWPVAEIIYQHHERLDGSGYPRGLRGDQIMMEARILAVADVVESMMSRRPYREAHTIIETLSEIEKNRGLLYDQRVVDVCLKLFREKDYKFSFNRQ